MKLLPFILCIFCMFASSVSAREIEIFYIANQEAFQVTSIKEGKPVLSENPVPLPDGSIRGAKSVKHTHEAFVRSAIRAVVKSSWEPAKLFRVG